MRTRDLPGEAFEVKIAIGDPKARLRASIKINISRKKSKVHKGEIKKTADQELSWSLGENKASLERAAGKTSQKLASALIRADVTASLIPGFPSLKMRYSYKALEAKFDRVKGETDLDLLKIQGSADGDLLEMLNEIGPDYTHDLSCKVSLECEIGLSATDLVKLREAYKKRKEVQAAAKAAADNARAVAKRGERLKALKAHHDRLQAQAKSLAAGRKAMEKEMSGLAGQLGQARDEAKWDKWNRERLGKEVDPRRPDAEWRKKFNKKQLELLDIKKEVADARLKRNTQKVQELLERAAKHREALGDVALELRQAATDLDNAIKEIPDLPDPNSTIAKIGKKSIEEGTEGIAKRFGKWLMTSPLIKKAIPGLNLITTAMDLVEVGIGLYELYQGKRKWGFPWEDHPSGPAGDSEKAASEPNPAKTGRESEDAPAVPEGDGQGAGEGSAHAEDGSAAGGSGEGHMSAEAKSVVDAFFAPTVAVDPEVARRISEMMPKDMTAAELAEVRSRLAPVMPGETQDPYEIVGKINIALDAIRKGGKSAKPASEPAGPPTSLLPGTRLEISKLLRYKGGQMELDPEQMLVVYDYPFTHPDGLTVKVVSVFVPPTEEPAKGGVMVVPVTVSLEVTDLPAGAGPDYPYTRGQTQDVPVTLLYSPKKKVWGELDQTLKKQLSSLVWRKDGVWQLKEANAVVNFEHAKVRVTRFLEVQTERRDDEFHHRITLEVVPIEITAKEAGYTGPEGWVRFSKGKAASVVFGLTEAAVPAGVGG